MAIPAIRSREKDVVSAVKGLLTRSRSESQDARTLWRKCKKWYQGQQKRRETDNDSQAWYYTNFIKSNVDSAVAGVTNFPPSISFEPVSVCGDLPPGAAGDVLNQIFPQVWDAVNAQRKWRELGLSSGKYGTGFMSVEWDPNARYVPELGRALGEIKLTPYLGAHCFWDPAATSIQDCSYFITAEELPRRQIEDTFGKKVYGGNLLSVVDWKRYLEGDPSQYRDVLLRCWLRDESELEVREGEGRTVRRRRYPNGLRLIIVAGETLLWDKPSPYEHRQIPMVRWRWVPIEGEFLGIGAVEAQFDAQRGMNDVGHTVMKNIRETGGNIVLRKNGTHVIPDDEKETNVIGAVYDVEDFDDIRIERGKGSDQGIIAVWNILRSTLDDLGGRMEAPIAALNRSHPASGRAVQAMAQQRGGRLQLTRGEYEDAVRDTAWLMLELMKQFYHEPRVYSMTGDMGLTQEWALTRDHLQGEWKIRVDVDSSIPNSRAAQRDWALMMLDKGIYPPEVFLDAVDDKYKCRVRAFLAQQQMEQQQAQMMEMMQAGAGPGGPGGPGGQLPPGAGPGAFEEPGAEPQALEFGEEGSPFEGYGGELEGAYPELALPAGEGLG